MPEANSFYLKCVPRTDIKFDQFLQEYHRNPILGQYDISLVNSSLMLDRDRIVSLLVEKGMTAVVGELLVEHLVTPGTPRPTYTKILHKYLDNAGVDAELIIVDPYFFPANHGPDYAQLVIDLLQRYLPNLSDLWIVTLPTFNGVLKTRIHTDLLNLSPAVRIHHETSSNYHDRFWITHQRQEGIFAGTSLNGFGKKYALIDKMQHVDVQEVVLSLVREGLL